MNNKEIKKASIGTFKGFGPGVSLKIFRGVGAKSVLGPIERKWYLRYKIKLAKYEYKEREVVVGEWVEKDSQPEDHKFTIAGIMARSEEIRSAGSNGVDLLAAELPSGSPTELRHKLKEFFETILFEGHPKAKLKWMADNRLTYFPERKVTKDGDNRKRRGVLVEGRPHNQAEPRYKDWEMSEDEPDKYPAISRDTYWDYVGEYNNWIHSSTVRSKPNAAVKGSKGTLIKNINYNEITPKLFKSLHIEILGNDEKNPRKYRANATLEMLRVFYNWLRNEEDKYITDNPVTKALSVPKTGPRPKNIDGKGTWAKITDKDIKKNKDEISEKKFNLLLKTIEDEIIESPTGKADRMRNRSLLFIQLRMMTGCRPDVGVDIKWENIKKKGHRIEIESVVSKGRTYNMNIKFAKGLIFDRIKEFNSDEPDHPFIFASEDKRGNQTGTKKVTKLWKRLREKCGIPRDWDFYNLKHTAISYLMKITDNDIAYVSEVTGVSKEIILKSYYTGSHTEENDQKVEEFFNSKLKLVVNNK